MSWTNDLQEFLNDLLSNVTDQETIDILLSKNNIETWEKAFTNETYSPDFNNEELEFLGDAILNSIFTTYLSENYPEIKSIKQLNNAKTKYMGGKYQYRLAVNLNLNKKGIIRHDPLLSNDTLRYEVVKDGFEGFFGGLFITSSSISKAFAFEICYDMLDFSLQNETLNFEETNLNEITTVKQLFTKFSIDEPRESVSDVDGRIKFQIILDKKHIEFWNRYLQPENIIQPGTIIGESTENIQKSAKAAAYSNAINFLASHSITTKKAKEIKFLETLKDPKISQILDHVYTKLKSEGYIDFKFKENKKLFENNKLGKIPGPNSKPIKTRSLVILYLIGITKNNKKLPIFVSLFDDLSSNYINSKYSLLKKYIESP